MRTLGLLTELSAAFEVKLLVLVREPLRADQRAVLATLSARVTEIPLRDATLSQRLRTAMWGGMTGRPYHCAVVESSLRAHPDVRRRLQEYPGVVYASYGHWGTLVRRRDSRNWILDQQHASADFCRMLCGWSWSLEPIPGVDGDRRARRCAVPTSRVRRDGTRLPSGGTLRLDVRHIPQSRCRDRGVPAFPGQRDSEVDSMTVGLLVLSSLPGRREVPIGIDHIEGVAAGFS